MGRLAGTSIAARKRQDWKARVEQAREHKATWGEPTKAPLVHPRASLRQRLLLWWLAETTGDMMIGTLDAPPLTPDMRALIARGHLILTRREPSHYWGERTGTRKNHIVITEVGRRAIANAKFKPEDIDYITRAVHGKALR